VNKYNFLGGEITTCLKIFNMSSIIRETKNIRVSDPKEPVKIFQSNDLDTTPPITLIKAFEKTVENFPNRNALMYKDELSGNKWQAITYSEYKTRVEKISKVFIKLGLERHGTVAVLAFNCKEWLITELATMHAG
jgi:non-ribosomal peptide synthetase component E (peptide arylation enzyme)